MIAAVLSFVLAHRLDGVREGTVIAALLVGFIARQFGKALTFVKPLLFPEDYAKSAEEESSGKNSKTTANFSEYASVITIGRQYGSGGSELGQILADKLGYNFYYYTRQIWGASANYHLSLDTSLGYDYVMDVILGTAKRLK